MSDVDVLRVHFVEVSAADAGQRVDNFIRKRYPSLPKSRIYQMLRKGEVRLNKKRVKPTDRIGAGDVMRLPPIIDGQRENVGVPVFWRERIAASVLFEDDDFLVLNKPAGIAVHGGSDQDFGVIDVVRAVWGEGYAELAHRLDRETSGVLVLGKHRAALTGFQSLMSKEDGVEKRYWALVNGKWDANVSEVVVQLEKGAVRGGERMVAVAKGGQMARTFFYVLREFACATLVEAVLDTGRTHQIRVSVQSRGHGIAGDEKYGDEVFNRKIRQLGFKGMFLHAKEIKFSFNGKVVHVKAPLPENCEQLLSKGIEL